MRSECLDWILVLGRRHLESVVQEFVRHYDSERPHRGLKLATPIARSPKEVPADARPVRRNDVLGALIYEYERAA
ncbi:MAG: integrase core domain-containing protein [Acidimicrobiales bacterium]